MIVETPTSTAPQLSPAFPLAWSSEELPGSGTVVVSVAGELDRHTSPSLRDHVLWRLASGCERIVLDTAGVTFADVATLEVLRDIAGHATRRGGSILLAPPGPAVRRLLLVFGLPDGVELTPPD